MLNKIWDISPDCGWYNVIRVGLQLPTIEVRFENLHVEAEAFVGSRALPSFANFNLEMSRK